MKNRLLSILLCFAMVLCLMPVSTFAEAAASGGHGSHCICGASDCGDESHGGTLAWTGISDLNRIIKAGNYYLTQDVKISSGVFYLDDTVGPVNLCLNGKTITWTGAATPENKYAAIVLTTGASLTITDCHRDDAVGKITRTNERSDSDKYRDYSLIYNGNGTLNLWNGCIGGNKAGIGVDNYYTNSTFNMYGGSIARNDSVRNGNGGGVYNYGTFNMYGGSIEYNVSTGGQNCGGAVYNSGKFNMTGGSIAHNTNYNAYGGGVYNPGTFTLTGGSITGNTSGYYGGGVFNTGTFTMSDGSVSGNRAYQIGGGVANNGTFEMSGGSITGNRANDSGGGVYNYLNHTFTMTGGSITGNRASESGGGVDNRGTFKLSGALTITANRKGGTFGTDGTLTGGTDNNVYISGDTCAISTEGLTSGASVGLNSADGTTVVTGTTSTIGFFSDDTAYELVNNRNNGLKLMLPVDHSDTHRICGESDCADAAHGDGLTWKPIDALSDIQGAGNYYLAQDVTLDDTWACEYDGVNLCLNGKLIIGKDEKEAIHINRGGGLTVTDCQAGGEIRHNAGEVGEGIFVDTDGTLTLWNGSVTGNTDNLGGGVATVGGGTFTMNGGSITGNTATEDGGGVHCSGTFIMNGGSISGNTATQSGGGVMARGGTFIMNGTAVIRNNNANWGGGVFITHFDDTDSVIMNGGSITGNTATEFGGGVYIFDGKFYLKGGTVADNSAPNGGGVFLFDNGSTFTMTGGSISGNTAAESGGGVNNGSTFTMSGGSITGNTVTGDSSYGAGVYNGFNGTFNMNGGSITGNQSKGYAGGVYNSNSFTMTDGIIRGNSGLYGGGVYNWKTFTMTGGSITGNIATGALDARGGGIHNHSNGTIQMSGSPTVTGNNKGGSMASDGTITGGKTENVYLIGTKTIAVTGDMAKNASVGISGTVGNTVVTGTSDTTGFFSDETDYFLKPDGNGGLMLARDSSVSGKLLVKADGDEMSDGKKTYDTNAVVFDGATVKIGNSTVNGATYTYVWQKKGEDGTYAPLTDLTGSTGPVAAGDYKLTVTATKNHEELANATWNFTIEKAKLTVDLTVKDKVYDGRIGTEEYTFRVTGVVGVDELEYTVEDVNFADANVGRDKTVTAKFAVSGEAAKNYAAPETVEGKASITPRALTVNVTAQDKAYDGTVAATVKVELDTSGIVQNDEVILVTDGVTAAFGTKNVGTGKSVTLSGSYTLSGAAAGNYTLVLSAHLTANIDRRALTVENLAVADKTYDGTDKATIQGTPTLSGVVGGEDVALVNGTPRFTGVAAGENIAIRFTEFTLSGADIGNYTLIQPTGIRANIIAYVSAKNEYKVSSHSNDWLNTDFVVTAEDGWQLSYANAAEGEWVDTLTASQETDNGVLHFYVRNKESGIISEEITEYYKIDKTVPTGEIRIDVRNFWEKFWNTVTFGLFYKDPQTVTVTANDNGSGVKTIEYLVTADVLSVEQLADKTFTAYEKPFGIQPDAQVILYAKITDVAGNVTWLRSNGIVLDGTAPVINGADNGRTYCAAVTLTITDEYLDTVTLNGDPVTLTDGKLMLTPAAGKQTVEATDEAGNRTTLTVTVNNDHTWGDWTSKGNNTHTRTCQADGTHTETAHCHSGTATCQAKAICDDCHQAYGDLGQHDWDTTAWGYQEADGHARTCKTAGCTAHDTVVAHTKDRDAATEEDSVKCTGCGYVIAPALGHICANHLTSVAAKAATCTESGNIAYYKCECGKLYADADAGTEITDRSSVIIAALGHKYSTDWRCDASDHWHVCQNEGCTVKADFAQHIPGAAATETAPQTCMECGYVLAPALGHICANHLTPVAAKAATCTEPGNTAYYKCECGRLYADADAGTEITEAQTVTAALGHTYEWKTDKEATATEKGLKHEECTVCHDKKAAVEIPATGETAPKTGDTGMLGLWIALLFVSGAGATVFSKRKRSVK